MSNQVKINSVKYFSVTTHHPSGGFSFDTDDLPRFGVFEQDGDTAIYNGIMAKRGGFTGLYRGHIPVSGIEGFDIGRFYDVVVSGAVQSLQSKISIDNFVVTEKDVDDIQVELTITSGDVAAIRVKTDQLTFSSSGVKSDVVAVSGVAIKPAEQVNANVVEVSGVSVNINMFQGGATGSGDWAEGEKAQIRDALGIDGLKQATFSGMLNAVSGDVVSIKTKTDQFTFSSSGVKVDVVAMSGVQTNINQYQTDISTVLTPTGTIDANITFVGGTAVTSTGDFQADTSFLARQAMLAVTSGDVLSVKAQTDQLSFSSSGVKADIVALSGVQTDINKYRADISTILPATGTVNANITFVGGTPVTSTGDFQADTSFLARQTMLAVTSGDVLSVKTKTDQLTFSSSGVKSDMVALDGQDVNGTGLFAEIIDATLINNKLHYLVKTALPATTAVAAKTIFSYITHDSPSNPEFSLFDGGAASLTSLRSVVGIIRNTMAASGEVTNIRSKTSQLVFSGSGVEANIISTSGNLVNINMFQSNVNNLTVAATGTVTANVISVSGINININQFQADVSVASGDWAEGEKAQIRHALGVDGFKKMTFAGMLNATSGDVISVKSKTNQLAFSGSGVKANIVALSGVQTNINQFQTDVSSLTINITGVVAASITGVVDANVTFVAGTTVTSTGDFQADLDALNVFHADIRLQIDGSGGIDEHTIFWFKNAARVTTGITNPIIHSVKRSSGTSLISPTPLTEIGSTHVFKYDATGGERQKTGESYIVSVSGTIEGSTRTFTRLLGRDNTS